MKDHLTLKSGFGKDLDMRKYRRPSGSIIVY